MRRPPRFEYKFSATRVYTLYLLYIDIYELGALISDALTVSLSEMGGGEPQYRDLVAPAGEAVGEHRHQLRHPADLRVEVVPALLLRQVARRSRVAAQREKKRKD